MLAQEQYYSLQVIQPQGSYRSARVGPHVGALDRPEYGYVSRASSSASAALRRSGARSLPSRPSPRLNAWRSRATRVLSALDRFTITLSRPDAARSPSL